MNWFLQYVVLPRQITEFERGYLTRVNAYATRFLILNVPLFVIIAAWNQTSPVQALLLSSLLVTGPVIAERVLTNPRNVSRVFAVAGIGMGGLLVHLGQGPMQIEMHFYFFVLIALLTIFANPSAILLAATTTAAHHLVIYLLFPASVFNYRASLWVVAVHAAFVVLESAACCFVARSFFDNVIGLEQIVAKRTAELAARGRDMKLVLDNVGQGFLRVVPDGTLSDERSAILERWFGKGGRGEKIWDYFGRADAKVGSWLRLGLESIADDIVPLELSLSQMPTQIKLGDGTTLSLVYRPILDGARLASLLVIVSDVTADIARGEAEAERADVVAVFERILKDRAGFVEFLAEAHDLVRAVSNRETSLIDARRYLHTLKGNSLLVGMKSLGALCHRLESRMEETGEALSTEDRATLVDRWHASTSQMGTLLGDATRHHEVSDADCSALRSAVLEGTPRLEVAQMIDRLRLEPVSRRLERVAEDARTVARRLGKGDLRVVIDAGDLRLATERWSPVWSSVSHIVRNALDHGVEDPMDRERAGKSPIATLTLRAGFEQEQIVISFSDDGRGVNWGEIKELARRRGLPHVTQTDLEQALFSDGLSTKGTVGEYSGRGVGMAAVLATTKDLGGHVRVVSEGGRGTRVELRFPLAVLHSATHVPVRRASSGRLSVAISAGVLL